jgi:hypothetical protein
MHSLTSALDEGECSASHPCCSTPKEKAPGTHWIYIYRERERQCVCVIPLPIPFRSIVHGAAHSAFFLVFKFKMTCMGSMCIAL